MFKNLRNTVSDFDRDDLLATLGLERKHSTAQQVMPALAIFGAGVLVGVGLGLILAPKAGAELRGDLRSQFKRVEERVRGNGALETLDSSPVPHRQA